MVVMAKTARGAARKARRRIAPARSSVLSTQQKIRTSSDDKDHPLCVLCHHQAGRRIAIEAVTPYQQ